MTDRLAARYEPVTNQGQSRPCVIDTPPIGSPIAVILRSESHPLETSPGFEMRFHTTPWDTIKTIGCEPDHTQRLTFVRYWEQKQGAL